MTTNATIQQTTTGNVKALCVLAAFSNRAFVKTNAEFDALMNQAGYSTGGAKGSVKDYYFENSCGQMNLQVSVIGPVTVSQSSYYYGTAADPTRSRWRTFASEVVNLVDPLVSRNLQIMDRLNLFTLSLQVMAMKPLSMDSKFGRTLGHWAVL